MPSGFESSQAGTSNQGPLAELPAGFPFAPDSAMYRLAEPTVFLLYPHIAGLTVMNDRIAAAVSQHSSFTQQPWNRLFGTLESALTLVFGEQEASLAMAHKLWHFHNTIQGNHKGITYSANDGNLQTWVMGSVFKGLEEARNRWSTPLRSDERNALYQDMKIFGQVFGIPQAVLPPDVNAFDTYWNAALDGGDFLLQTDVSRTMARTVYQFRNRQVPAFVSRVSQAVSLTSLDERLQDRAGLRPTQLDGRLGRAVDLALHSTYTRLSPETKLRLLPGCLATHRKVAAGLGRLSAAKKVFWPTIAK